MTLRVGVNPNPIPGIDVSHWQGTIDWTKVKSSGVQFAYIKATQGQHTIDPKYLVNCQGCKDNGILRGSYHYFQYGVPVQAQLDNFYNILALSDNGELPAALDLENGPMDQAEFDQACEFLTQLKDMFQVEPVLYVDLNVAGQIVDLSFAEFLLWIADYSLNAPTIPGSALQAQWTFWQYSANGWVPGIQGDVDLDWFNGTIEQLGNVGALPSEKTT